MCPDKMKWTGLQEEESRKEGVKILVNKANLVHNLFLVYLSIFTCFVGQLCTHHQEKQLCLCYTWYLLFCVDDWYAYQTVFHTVVSPDDGHVFDRKHVEKRNKHTKKSFVSSWLYLQDYAVMQVNKT